jgi:pimeloyl-ACP methyl ester carboxylesterase
MNHTVSAAIPDGRLSRRSAVARLTGAGAAAVIAAVHLGWSSGAAQAAAQRPRSSVVTMQEGTIMTDATPTAASGPLTVVLVHGAFADASSWAGVIPILQAAGVDVLAPANPLRGIGHDATYIASVASQVPGPVLLVGHSYGGAVITSAGSRADNVRGLVYVGAFIPDEGETLQALADQATDSKVLPALRPMPYPTTPGAAPDLEFTIDAASFHEIFCADLPAAQAAILAVSQRPLAGVSFGEPTQDPAWKTLPAWAIISPSDFIIGPSGERFMAERSGATITEVEASHAMMISQPQVVADVILTAVGAVAEVGAVGAVGAVA